MILLVVVVVVVVVGRDGGIFVRIGKNVLANSRIWCGGLPLRFPLVLVVVGDSCKRPDPSLAERWARVRTRVVT